MTVIERLKNHCRRTGWRRFFFVVLGNAVMGAGISIFRLSLFGNDPYSAMILAISAKLGISYPLFQVMVNVVFFAAELAFGRHYIGIGTIVNAVFLGYFAAFFYWLFCLPAVPQGMAVRIAELVLGVIVCSLGLSLYQTTDAGVSPFDSFAIILHERIPRVPYFWWRILCDGCCALIAYLAGGIVGLGTLSAAFGMGPVIHFFNRHVSEKLINKQAKEA